MALRVTETMIFVRDLDEAIRFQTEKLGFRLEQRFDWGFAYIDMGGHRLGLMLESKWQREYPDDEGLPRPRVSLETDDLDAVLHHLHQRGVRYSTVQGHEGATRAVTFYDDDGNPFFLWSDPASPQDF